MKPATTEALPQPPVPEMTWNRPRVRVAMVEDSTGFAEMLAACLGHQTEIELLGGVSTVREAVQRLPVWKPNVVLLDLGLPDGSGIEVLRALAPSMVNTAPALRASRMVASSSVPVPSATCSSGPVGGPSWMG